MSKPARRKDMDRLAGTLEHVADVMSAIRLSQEGRDGATHLAFKEVSDKLADHGKRLDKLSQQMALWPAADVDRVETLLGGVKAALERMGGNSLPSALNDILALRDQMSEFRRALEDHRNTLIRVLDTLDVSWKPPQPEQEWFKPKRKYNRRKKVSEADQPQAEKTEHDAAPHNDQSEVESEA